MSCHYSCATCSASFYFDLCTACPATRSLAVTTCPCSYGYYEYQQAQCTASSSASGIDSALLNIAAFTYYASIALHYLIIVLTINRVLSVKLKKIVDACQVLAIINYYRFLQPQVATSALQIMDVFNFSYLTNLMCTPKGPPYGCSNFENLFGVLLTFVLFFFLFLISFFIGHCIYSAQSESKVIYVGKRERGREGNLGFMTYWQSLSSSLFLLYLDQTAIQTTLSICRVAITNYYGFFVVIPFIVLVVLVARTHFTTVNDSQQSTLAYRARHNYFYYYDEYYHFNYIDHLFETENVREGGETLKKPFYPHSNLMAMEILFKVLVASSTIVFYQYQPYLFILCSIFLLLVYSCNMQVFFTYQIFDLWFYYALLAVLAFANAAFATASFPYFILITAFALQVLALIFLIIAISSWRREKEGEMFKKTFEMVRERSQRVANLEESENELVSNKNESEEVQVLSIQQQTINPRLEEPNQLPAADTQQKQVIPRQNNKKQSDSFMESKIKDSRSLTKRISRNIGDTEVGRVGRESRPSMVRGESSPSMVREGEREQGWKNILIPEEDAEFEQ